MIQLLTRSCLLGLLLAAAGGGALYAEGLKGRPIEFSEPPSERGQNEETKLVPGQTRLGRLETELSRPFENLSPGKSLDGMMLTAPAPMPPPAVQSPRARELSDRKQDWMFLSPEELFAVRSVEDKYKKPELTPDGRDKNLLRPMTRAYLEAVEGGRSAVATNGAGPTGYQTYDTLADGAPGGFSQWQPPLSARASSLASEFRAMAGLEANADTPQAADATDFFKFNRGYQAPSKPTDAELQRVEQFKKIYDFNPTTPDPTVARAERPFTSPYVDQSFFAPPKPATPAATAYPSGVLNGSSGQAATPSWTPTPPPPPEPSRSVPTPASPFFNMPRRGF